MSFHVDYKVYTFWGGNEKPEVRRFIVDGKFDANFSYLKSKLQELLPNLKKKDFTVSWKDEEGDDVVIASDGELAHALQSLGTKDPKKLNIHCEDKQSKADEPACNIPYPNPDSQAVGGSIHLGVVCDGCDGPVVGFRYKCTSCDDFDLCSNCEASGHHAEHCMVRIPVPNLPSAVIRNATKRYRHFLKTAKSFDEDACKKQQRRERSGDRKRRDHGHGHHHRHHSGDGDHHRRQRISWLDTFANYMNEFANLAGDVKIDIQTEAKPTVNPTQDDSKIINDEPQAPKETAKESTQTQNEIPRLPFNIENIDVQNIHKLLNMYMGGINTSTPKPSTSAKPEQSPNVNNVTTQSASNNEQDVEMTEANNNSETDKDSVTSEVSSTKTVESQKEDSPERADDWTVINKDQDLMDNYGNTNGPPIGFNLPEEFQERVTISQGGNLYPPLNTETAVLNPKELEPPTKRTAELPKPAQAQASVQAQASADSAPSAPSALTQPKQQQHEPEPQRNEYHPLAHIDAAIDHMLAMGFTNEGAWLTQLLESKDGNIAAVLDLLTPVNPKK